ncbi:MAG: M1 family metallopeptidase [Nitrospinaceae bacterium]
MRNQSIWWTLVLLSGLNESAVGAENLTAREPIHHQLSVELDPARSTAHIRDELTLHPGGDESPVLFLVLNGGFHLEKIEIVEPENRTDLNISRSRRENRDPALTEIEIRKSSTRPWPNPLKMVWEYRGPLPHPEPPSPPDSPTPGIQLSGADYFYPQTLIEPSEPGLLTFRMIVGLPPGWKAVSQGRRMEEPGEGQPVTWESIHPMEEIFLIADRFEEFRERDGDILLYAFLLKKDPRLAKRYLDGARKYLAFFEKLLGAYPYYKFALVENSRQTGYGMPSFTLLGSTIIRFPFILNTSYPHEILHNWWGNGVYIDPRSGNWSEGLTAYLADHLLQELDGHGAQYRFRELMKYLNYVNESNDFPLTEFKSRTTVASQAIGYGKMLFLLHMVKTRVGNAAFLQAVRNFYAKHRFGFAGLDDLAASFSSASGKDLQGFFKPWIHRTGAPVLELGEASTVSRGGRFLLRILIRQGQSGPPFPVPLPVAVWLKGSLSPRIEILNLEKKLQTFTLDLPREPGKILIDPYTDVFRKLDRKEVPPSIGQTYGSVNPSRILPSVEEFPDVLLGYYQFAQSLVENAPVSRPIIKDSKFSPVPKGSLWVFGRQNEFARHLQPQLKNYGVRMEAKGVIVEGKSFSWEGHSFVFTLRRPGNREGSATWVIAGSGESIPGLIRKLPHYGNYGFLVFKGDAPENVLKGTWPSQAMGRMKTFYPGKYTLPPPPPLVDFKPGP